MVTQIVITANKLIASKEVLCGGRLCGHDGGQLPGHLASQVRAIVVIALDDSDISMAAEFLHGPDIAPGEIKCRRNGRMTEAMRPDSQARLGSQLPNHVV
jgi:hypothetical protein